jgi:hypothetical protein
MLTPNPPTGVVRRGHQRTDADPARDIDQTMRPGSEELGYRKTSTPPEARLTHRMPEESVQQTVDQAKIEVAQIRRSTSAAAISAGRTSGRFFGRADA